MKYLAGRDYFVTYETLPWKIRGLVTPNSDGTFTIVLNSRLSNEQKEKTYRHEINHLESEDFYNGMPIELVEGP